jgi:hypothetical protein
MCEWGLARGFLLFGCIWGGLSMAHIHVAAAAAGRQIQALHRISAANCESVDHLSRRGFVQQGTDWQRDVGSTHSPAASDARRS